MVRIHPDPPGSVGSNERGCSSIGRAPALQAGGRRFDPVQLHQVGMGKGFTDDCPLKPIGCSSAQRWSLQAEINVESWSVL